MAAHPEADGDDRIEVVMIDLSRYLPGALNSNYSEFPNSCLGRQFPFCVNAF
jgi:hypothetical protein